MTLGRCTNCGSPWIPGAAWCGRCGARPDARPQSTALDGSPAPLAGESSIRLCPECGVIAPTERGRCERCNTAYGPQCPTASRSPDGTAWAWMECWLDCGCGAIVPLTPAMVGTDLACGHCGQAYRIETHDWQEALELAHGVIDLSPPDPHGRNVELGAHNPFAQIGVTETFARLPGDIVAASGPVQLRAAPGLPLCPRCSTALTIRLPGQGRATTECPRCGDREVFAVPTVLQRAMADLHTVLAFNRPGPTGLDPWWLLFEGEGGMRAMVAESKARYEREEAERAAREEAEARAREQAERDRIAREAREKIDRDRRERERVAREARERAEREVWEQAERERVAREAEARAEQEAREQAEREREAREAREAREEADRQRAAWEAWEKADAERRERERIEHEAWQRAEAEKLRRATMERRGRIAAWACGALLLLFAGVVAVLALR